MAFTHVQSAAGGSAAGSVASFSVSFGSAVTSGNFVIGIVSPHVSSVTDDKGNTYNLLTALSSLDGFFDAQVFYLFNITNGPITLTANYSPNGGFPTIAADEYHTNNPVELGPTSSHADGSAPSSLVTSATSGSVTLKRADALVWGGTVTEGNNALSAGSGFTQRGNEQTSGDSFTMSEDQLSVGTGSIAATFTAGGTGDAFVTFLVSVLPIILPRRKKPARPISKPPARKRRRFAPIIQAAAAAVFIPRRKPHATRRKPLQKRALRRKIAPFIGAAQTLIPVSKAWNWLGQAAGLLAVPFPFRHKKKPLARRKQVVWVKRKRLPWLTVPAAPAFIPRLRKRKPASRHLARKPLRRRVAPFIGAATFLFPPSRAWLWNAQAALLNLTLGTVSKAWNWNRQAALLNLTLGTASKAWVWTKNTIPGLPFTLGVVSKAWNWTHNPAILISQNIKQIRWNVLRPILWGVLRGEEERPRKGP